MLTELLELLKNDESFSIEMLAEKLNTGTAQILSALQYLETLGYIKKGTVQSACPGSCKHCSGCAVHGAGAMPDMWELKTGKH